MQTITLSNAEVYSLITAATWIRCESGQLWISQDGQDIVLARGEKYYFSGADKIVLEALLDSRFTTYESAPAIPAIQVSQHMAVAH